MSDAPAINTSMTASQWAILVTLSVLWGASFFFNGVAVAELPVFTVVVVRVALAAAILQVALRLTGQRIRRDPRLWGTFFAMALINNVMPFSLIVWSQSHIASGLAAIVNATTPLFTVLVAHVFTRDEKLSAGRITGVAIGLSGVAIMIGLDALETLGGQRRRADRQPVRRAVLCLGAVFGRRFREMNVTPLETATGQVTASSVMLIPVMLLVDQPWTLAMPGPGVIAALDRRGRAVDRAGLYPVFPAAGERGRDQRAAGDVPRPGRGDPAGHPVPWRGAGAAASARDGADRSGPRGDRRAARAAADAHLVAVNARRGCAKRLAGTGPAARMRRKYRRTKRRSAHGLDFAISRTCAAWKRRSASGSSARARWSLSRAAP